MTPYPAFTPCLIFPFPIFSPPDTLLSQIHDRGPITHILHVGSSPGSLPPSQPSSPPDPSPSPDDMLQTPSPPISAPPPLAPLPPSPLRITPFPVAVSEALDYMQSIDPAASGILDTQAVVMQNIRLVEAARVIGSGRRRPPLRRSMQTT